MTAFIEPIAVAEPRGATLRDKLQHHLPRLVLAPSFLLVLIFVYGFNLWTFFLSFTNSKGFTSTKLIGLANYQKLWNWTFETDPHRVGTRQSSTWAFSADSMSSSVSSSA